jgi:hypothetical protein
MVLAGRSSRRGRKGQWWLLAGLIATLIVLLVNASVRARDPGPQRTLAADTWVDRVLPVIGDSTSQGIQLNQLRANGSGMTANELNAQYQQVANAANQSLATVEGLQPPSEMDVANGYLTACLQTRAQAANAMWQAVHQYLSAPAGTSPASAASTIVNAASQFGVSNQAYQLFVRAVPRLNVTLPASSWDPMPAAYTTPAVTTFLTSVHQTSGLTSAPDLAVLTVATNPPAVGLNGTTQLLAPDPSITVVASVANQGNVVENAVPVTASLNAVASPPSSVSQPVTLQPGQKASVMLGPLRPPVGPVVNLTVSMPTVPGETNTANNSKTIAFQMAPGTTPPSTG